MAFKSIHTALGLAAIAEAEVSGVPINLTEMAIGDGLGNPVLVLDADYARVVARGVFS